MSILDWIFRNPFKTVAAYGDSSGLVRDDATLPIIRGQQSAPVDLPGTAVNRRVQRMERREKLYAIVRESMTRAGILSSSYKFKVLSLDSRGKQFIVMMDVAPDQAEQTDQLTRIESVVASSAKSRFDIVVTSVYWRVNLYVTDGLAARKPAVKPVAEVKQRFELLAQDEVDAFKKALSNVPAHAEQSKLGVEHRSARRNPAPEPEAFQDTELEEFRSPLSGTQYGELI